MIEERKRMSHYRSHSIDSSHERSRTPSHDDADEEDEVINSSNTHVRRTSKRRILTKKRPQYNNQLRDDDDDDDEDGFDASLNVDSARRRLSR